MTPRDQILLAMSQQRGIQPQGQGPLTGLNQALQNGMKMYGMGIQAPGSTPRPPDPVMGTGYPMGLKG